MVYFVGSTRTHDSAYDCAAGLGAIRLQTGGVCRGRLDPRTCLVQGFINNLFG